MAAIELGVMMFATDKSIQPVELAKEVEARGFASLWFPEHSHIPTSRATPWGGRQGAPALPEEYWRTHDQFIALGAAAAVTSRIKLGTGITLVAQRDPIWLAKEVATLDVISGGRFLFGIGYGWNKEEMLDHGVRYTERRDMVREKILAMKELWTKDEASFSGRFVNFESSWAYPKPIQQPHPPVILGGAPGPRTFAAVVEYADAWMPVGGRYPILETIEDLRKTAEAAGRDPASIDLGIFSIKPDPAYVNECIEAGVRFAALGLPSAPRDEVLAALDAHADVLAQFS
ncbi:MAG: LLM class F420-dependent oxidoreductase [Acidimicrobiales bacterium]